MMRPLWYPSRQERVIYAIKKIAGWALLLAVFAGIGVMLAWRG